ncbi:uncharacterized protein ACA1_377950 [Acanthamoeba castellanii str. Neff]|uniref:Uncharacterized protein n=1 Tax=Acanthamoeba castellanii (strain ATCC 30010 / Neff) TaxID=1257118 RepID=L8GRA4_ACACF|nr:uncharacterized protein ACA1_377950 [Acanthamoeba castellanii str. Neff]ELR15679.1 hypothetical protein ACA1_377950 [Acanthamoeba castellanii str. Neff]
MRHWLSKHLKGRERSDSADRDDDSTKERRDGEWGSGLITVALLPDLGSTTSSSAHSLRHQRARHPRDAAGDRVTRGGDDGDDAELPKDRAWRSRVKPLATDDRRRTSVQRADSDLRSRMVRNPSFARSRYVLTNTGAWTRVAPPGSPGGGRARDLQRKRTRDGLARQRSAERDACPPGLFLIRYLNPCAADLLAGDMRLVDGRWVKNEEESEVLDLGDEEELLKWAEDDVYYQPLPKEFDVDEEQLRLWRECGRKHEETLGEWVTCEQDPQYVRRFKEEGLRQLWIVRVVDRANRPPAAWGRFGDDDEDDESRSSRPSAIVQHQGVISFAAAEMEDTDLEMEDEEDDGFEDGLEIPEEFGLVGKRSKEENEDEEAAKGTEDSSSSPAKAKSEASALASAGLTLRRLTGNNLGGQATRQMAGESGGQNKKRKDHRGTVKDDGDDSDDEDHHHGLPTALNWLIGTLRKVMEDTSPSPLVLETFLEEDPDADSSDDNSSWD